MRAKALKYGIRLVGPLLFALVLWKAGDLGALASALRRVTPWPVLLACGLNAVNVHLKIVRTQLLAGLRGLRYRTGDAWRAMLPSLYLGMVTPGRVGDALRVQYMRRDLGTPYSEGLAILVMDRLADLYVLLGFAAVGVAHFAAVLDGRLGTVTWLGVVATALLPLVLLLEGPSELALRVVRRRFRGEGFERFLAALRSQLRPRLGWAVPLTVLAFLVNYLQGWLAARALGLQLAYADVIFMMAITSLLGLLPISMSGAGVREVFLALVFPSLGLAREEGVAFGLVIFAVIYVFCSLAGFVAWQLAPPPFDVASGVAPGSSEGEDGAPGSERLANSADPGDKTAVSHSKSSVP